LLPNTSKQKTLKAILGFKPKNLSLYEQAFTHKSIVNESEKFEVSNERLEFLGDAILGAIVAEYFFNRFPYEEEGFLTKVRSKLVSRNFLNQLSVDIGLDTFLETSADVNRSKSIFGDAFEALIGAIYLDRGYKTCRKFVLEKVIIDYVDVDRLIEEETDFKSKLVEWVQKNKAAYEYKITEVNRGKYNTFRCELYINNKKRSTTEERSKKRAEQEAAKDFFHQLSVE
tara:strand:- start:56919 stop:57602 length:684 start_codon:yes stop_codon:yes gene_type:complete